MGFLKTLAKVGLVELDEPEQVRVDAPPGPGLDDADLQRILAEDPGPPPPATEYAKPDRGTPYAPPSPSGRTVPAPPQTGAAAPASFGESMSFEALYAQADVPPSAYPAEKLLKLLDGLRAMDPATRKVAVLAMDAADDDWTVADAVLDAQRKTRALRQAEQGLAAALRAAEQQVEQELAANDQYRDQATTAIRKQIADLEILLQEELQKVAEKKAQAAALLDRQRDAHAREVARYEQEIARLMELSTTFGSDPPPPTG